MIFLKHSDHASFWLVETGSSQKRRGVSIGVMGASEPGEVTGSMDPHADKGKE